MVMRFTYPPFIRQKRQPLVNIEVYPSGIRQPSVNLTDASDGPFHFLRCCCVGLSGLPKTCQQFPHTYLTLPRIADPSPAIVAPIVIVHFVQSSQPTGGLRPSSSLAPSCPTRSARRPLPTANPS